MRRQQERMLRCIGGAAAIVVASVPLTSCDAQSVQAQSVGYVAVVKAHSVSKPAVSEAANAVAAPEVAVPVQPPAEPLGPVPAYTVINERTNDRSDKATTFYVVLGPVDAAAMDSAPAPEGAGPVQMPVQMLGEEAGSAEFLADVVVPVDPAAAIFKPSVKQVLRSLALVNGGPDFTAHIWDEVTAAQTEVSYKSAPDLFSDQQYAAKEAANAQHFVASYQGGVGQAGQPAAYVLFWYPDAVTGQPASTGLMSSEVWRP